MARALASACLVLAICFGGSAWAKPKIAILGLEAAPGPSGAVDPATTQVARAITRELRQRAQGVGSPYAIAPNSSKELTDEKLLMSCDSEAAACMAVIGAGLAADILLYGRVEKKGELYRVSLKRLDVKARTVEAGGEELPVGGAVASLARRLYIKLIGESSVAGTLIVKATSQTGAQVDTGSVLIDEENRGTLAGGRVTVTGLTEGRHVLAIEADGFRRFEETVTIRSGEQATLSALLLVRDGQDSSPSPLAPHSALWKWSLGAGVVLAAAGGGFAGYSLSQRNKYLADDRLMFFGDATKRIGSGDCDKTDAQLETLKAQDMVTFSTAALRSSCTWKQRIYVGFVIGGVGVVGAVVSLIMLSRDTDAAERPATGARGKKPEVALRPILTPDSAGASLSLAW